MAPGDVPIQVILEQFNKMPAAMAPVAKVLVSVFSPELMDKSLQVSSRLRSNNINTETWPESDSKLDKQLNYADQKGIPYVVIIGPDEAANNQVTVKDLRNKTQETISTDEILQKVS